VNDLRRMLPCRIENPPFRSHGLHCAHSVNALLERFEFQEFVDGLRKLTGLVYAMRGVL